MSSRQPQEFDFHGELVSGDPTRQSRALLAILGLLSVGREVGSYISTVCAAILGNANVSAPVRCTAYDVVAAATPSDADCLRLAAAIVADLQKGTPAELRVKALGSLSLLPAHRLLGLLDKEPVRDRLNAALRAPTPSVRAAAIEALNGLITGDAVPAAAYYHPDDNGPADERVSQGVENVAGVAALLNDAVASAEEGLIDDDATVVSASCRALTALLEAAAAGVGIQGTTGGRAVTESARASSVRINLGLIASEALDESFAVAVARFRTLPAMIQCDTPPLVCAYLKVLQARAGVRALDSLPGDAVGTRGHAFEESAALLAELVRGGDPPAVMAAAQGLFELAEMDTASATLQALLPSAIAAAVGAAAASSGHQRAVAQHAVLELLLRHLEVLPSVQRAALFSRLVPMIAAMPVAGDRVSAFYRMWSAVSSFDWGAPQITAAPARGRGPPPAVPTPQLQLMLLDLHIKEAISGANHDPASPAGPPPHPRYRDPIFREEMVGTLLYVLVTHPRPGAVTGDGVVAASSAVAQASAVQAAAAAVDWLVTAKMALLGTKACLGWDRMAGVPTTGSTAAADLWLQLLLRCIQLSRALKAKLGPAKAAVAAAAAAALNAAPVTTPGGTVIPPVVDPGSAALAGLVRRASELEGEMQGLLLQIAANWRALHPMVRPRAVWLCACHLHFRNVIDSAWTSVADAVHGLLADARSGDAASAAGYMAAVSEGKLRLRDGGSSGRHEAGVAAGAGEAEEVALLALEGLAALVSSNHHGKLEGQLTAVAGLLEKLATVQSGLENLSPSATERLARVEELLKPVSTAGKKSAGKKDGKSGVDTTTAATPNAAVIMELVPDAAALALAPASYPSTLPTAFALFSAPEATRYRKFLEQLQAAALEKSVDAGGGAAAVAAAIAHPCGGLPSLQQLTDALEGIDGSATQAVTVTGPAAPVTLSLSHVVDPGAGSIRLICSASNRTLQPLSGVAVTLLLGGPIADNRRPLTFRLGSLPAGDSSTWEVPVRVTGFGWPVIQPALTLPASVPTGQPTLRCRPYAISPLQLLAPPARAMSPAEFYQRWQAMPHRACVGAAPAEPGALGVQRVLAAIEGAGLTCVMKAVVPVAGGVHAAFHGAAWSGESIAVVVTSSAESSTSQAGLAPLHLHFGSEASEVVAHVRGHEAELLVQLTGGAAVPAVSGVASGTGDVGALAGTAAAQAAREEDRPTTVSSFSFLRSVALQLDAERNAREGEEDEDAIEKEAAMTKETESLHYAALAQWQKVHALRIAL